MLLSVFVSKIIACGDAPPTTDTNLHFQKCALPPPLGEVAERIEAGEGIGPLSHLR